VIVAVCYRIVQDVVVTCIDKFKTYEIPGCLIVGYDIVPAVVEIHEIFGVSRTFILIYGIDRTPPFGDKKAKDMVTPFRQIIGSTNQCHRAGIE
jgi:hypothetical protein